MAPEPAVTCTICGRSLLLGELPLRFSPDGREFRDVCPLCKERALELGWYREGAASHPVSQPERRPRGILRGLLGRRENDQASSHPGLQRLAEPGQAALEAAELFNSSTFRRTAEGIAHSLGAPQVSIVPLSGLNPEVVITIAWDISWYQYRIDFDSAQPVRLAERGYEVDQLDPSFATWNAHWTEDGLIAPLVESV